MANRAVSLRGQTVKPAGQASRHTNDTDAFQLSHGIGDTSFMFSAGSGIRRKTGRVADFNREK